MKKQIFTILEFSKLHKWKFVLLFLCVIITTFSGAFYPYIFGRLVDEVFYSKNMSMFLNIIIIYGAVYLFNQIMHFVLNMTWAKLMTRFLFEIRDSMYKKVLSYKGNRLSNINSGDIIWRMNNDVEQFMNFIHWNVFYTIGGLLSLMVALGFLFFTSWPLAVFAIIMTPISVYASRTFAKKLQSYYQELSDKNGLLASWLFEIIKGMQDIKLLSAAKHVLSSYIKRSIKITRVQVKANRVEIISDRVNTSISLFVKLGLYVLSVFLIFSGYLTLGGFTACVSYLNTCISVFNNLNNKINAISGNMISISRVIDVLDEQSEEYNEDRNEILITNGKIEFIDVEFSYNENIKIFDKISFCINAGDKISIVGHSGSGKSTIANLIYKLYEIQSGDILVDNISIYDFNLNNLRAQIGIVHQETILFEGTIRYNLTFSDDNSNDDAIFDVLKQVHLFDFVKQLPDGLDTVLDNAGRTLSGGQKQRLAIARIFVKNPKIIIFDEATSFLDNEAEEVIKDSWEELCKGRTIIIIAHRLSTIMNSDKLLVLQEGNITGYDTHDNLLKSCNAYVALFKEQYSLEEVKNYG